MQRQRFIIFLVALYVNSLSLGASSDKYVFTVTNTRFTWLKARTHCLYAGGDLASILNAKDQVKIDKITNPRDKYWIGFNDRSREGSFVWSDGRSTGSTAWNQNEPNDFGGEDCTQLIYDGHQGKWNDFSCSLLSKSICKIPVISWEQGGGSGGTKEYVGRLNSKDECVEQCRSKSKNGIPANGVTVDLATERMCYCEFGQTGRNSASWLMSSFIRPLSNRRYGFKIMNSSLTWSEARHRCEYDGGDLASIHNAKDQLKIDYLTEGKGRYWIGYNDLEMEGSFVWSDGSARIYTKWNSTEPNDAGGEDCASISYSNKTSTWNDLGCSSKLKAICRIQVTSDEQYEFQVLKLSLPWVEARLYCEASGGDLASILSPNDQVQINAITRANDTYAIGYNDRSNLKQFKSKGNFVWSDGSASSFTNWYKDWYKKDPNNGNVEEDCTKIAYKSPFYGKWNDYKCNRSMKSICKVPRALINFAYVVPRLQLPWQHARDYCRVHSGDLVSIKDKYELEHVYKAVKRDITYYWIGLHAPSTSGDLFWSDNSPFQFKRSIDSYSIFRRCVQTIYSNDHNGTWIYKSCNETCSFMCKFPVGSPGLDVKYTRNIALGMPTSQCLPYGGQIASRAVDGNPSFEFSTLSCTHTKIQQNPWWRVDLRRIRDVKTVKITGCSDAYDWMEVRVGNVGYHPSSNSLCYRKYVQWKKTSTITCYSIMYGRFVYVILDGYKYLTLAEVEVFTDGQNNWDLKSTLPPTSTTGGTVTAWKRGAGGGGERDYIGSFNNKETCLDRCSGRSKYGMYANGVTVDWATQRKCFCEYGQTWRNIYNTWYMNIRIKPAPSSTKIFFIKHYSGLCVALDTESNRLILTKSCDQKFMLASGKNLEHYKSGKCAEPESLQDDSFIRLDADCSSKNSRFIQTDNYSMKNIATGKCIHPFGGMLWPKPGTKIVIYGGCGEDRFQFKFILDGSPESTDLNKKKSPKTTKSPENTDLNKDEYPKAKSEAEGIQIWVYAVAAIAVAAIAAALLLVWIFRCYKCRRAQNGRNEQLTRNRQSDNSADTANIPRTASSGEIPEAQSLRTSHFSQTDVMATTTSSTDTEGLHFSGQSAYYSTGSAIPPVAVTPSSLSQAPPPSYTDAMRFPLRPAQEPAGGSTVMSDIAPPSYDSLLMDSSSTEVPHETSLLL